MVLDMAKPLVSVIVPTYNCAAYIGEALSSVFEQTYSTYEIIVVDDGSTDHTEKVLAPYVDKIQYLYQNNRGVSAARNAGIARARGEFVALLDADDVWFPRKLELQVQALKEHPEAGLVFTDFQDFDASGVTRNSRFNTWRGFRAWFDQHRLGDSKLAWGAMYEELLRANWIHTSSVLLRKAALEEVRLFDEAFAAGEDYDLWLRIAKLYPVVCVNRVLSGYRFRPQSLSGLKESRGPFVHQGTLTVLEKHLRNEWIPRALENVVLKELSYHWWGLGWTLFGQNRFAEARSRFVQGIRYHPFQSRNGLYWMATWLPLPVIEAVRRFRRWRRSSRLHAEPTARNLAITPSSPDGPRRTI